ncbi:glycosyl hydrolase [Bacteroidota bacterium]
MRKISTIHILTIILLGAFYSINSNSQITQVGSGSYTNTFPGTDVAGRNDFPSGSPQISGKAASKPVPTNDWWSTLIKSDHANNMFNYPLALATINEGLTVAYIVPSSGPNGSSQPMGDAKPITIGISGMNSGKATVADYSDWTVTMDWNDGEHEFMATAGIALPFLYFTKNTSDVAEVTVYEGTVHIDDEILVIENSQGGSDFAVYAPTGSSWTQNGLKYTSTLNGQNYWSMVYLPPSASDVNAVAIEYRQYAYVFPVNTVTEWNYDEGTAALRTVFTIETEVKEGTDSTMLQGLLPHQWAYLAPDSPVPQGYTYSSIRGEIKTIASNSFMVENTFYGVLPTLPYLSNYSEGFSPAEMNQKISLLENDVLSSWTDSYNEGQVMNRLIQTARIAHETGDTEARDKMIATIRERLEDWLTAETGEVAFLFYYNSTWSTLIGYPAGHGQDYNINDHHFHWGYFIHAAAFIEQFNPGWADQWGDMINLLIRDAANPSRNDPDYPFLRSFSPFAGHCWANGFATFPFGNDQESSSESMQFNSSLIHWGSITENDSIRDLGIYLYTTEETAINEYWFDINQRTHKPEYNYSVVSRIWGNGYDNQTFWTGDIEAVYGIEMYPIHGGSLYLGRDTVYVRKLWEEIVEHTGILQNEANPNLWHDLMWEYLAFIDPEQAIELYESYPDRSLKFGVSDAQTYYWLHSLNALGRVANITADFPVSAVFVSEGDTTYVAYNYSDVPVTVSFSDGKKLEVAAKSMATSKDLDVSGYLSSSFSEVFTNGSVDLSLDVFGPDITKVEIFDGNNMIATLGSEPYEITVSELKAAVHNFYARIYVDSLFAISNIVPVQVGRQLPYLGAPIHLPGSFEAGHFDSFEGGPGQGISYSDASVINEGGFRVEEYVDAEIDNAEGATIGWLSDGEWLEYTIYVDSAGTYTLDFRYASDNDNGGGPFFLELDGQAITDNITINSTGGWDVWATQVVPDVELTFGEHILRLIIEHGEVNLGRMTFTYDVALSFSPPVANAGENIIVVLPSNAATLDGSQSFDPENEDLSYTWEQVYGPSLASYSDTTLATLPISNLLSGVYLFKLTVSDGTYSDTDDVLVIVSPDSLLAPNVTIVSPLDNLQTNAGIELTIIANADDLDGSVEMVEFFLDSVRIGLADAHPFSIIWTAEEGQYVLTAIVTDDDSLTAISAPVNITVGPAPPCSGGPENGDYTYEFSSDRSNPGITFLPGRAGVGSPTCLLYYSTGGGYAPVSLTPNVPVRLSLENGQTVTFYFTYSVPEGGERNTLDNQHTFVVGNCSGGSLFNTAPIANAGQNITLTLPANNITLDGSGSRDPDSDPLTYLWEKKSGPDVTLSSTNVPILELTNLEVGIYLFSLTVTDDKGLSDTDEVTVTVESNVVIIETGVTVLRSYPNPVDEFLYISLVNNSGNIYVRDILGNLIEQFTVVDYNVLIDMKNFHAGIYFIIVQDDSDNTVLKIVKR